jgi:hypothetical protein
MNDVDARVGLEPHFREYGRVQRLVRFVAETDVVGIRRPFFASERDHQQEEDSEISSAMPHGLHLCRAERRYSQAWDKP